MLGSSSRSASDESLVRFDSSAFVSADPFLSSWRERAQLKRAAAVKRGDGT